MMDLDIRALIEDTELARVRLFNQHCKHADNQEEATIGLASQLLYQAEVVLKAVYGDRDRAREHCRRVFSTAQS